jgi:hypothetical protein
VRTCDRWMVGSMRGGVNENYHVLDKLGVSRRHDSWVVQEAQTELSENGTRHELAVCLVWGKVRVLEA